jgi:hypothetical protein
MKEIPMSKIIRIRCPICGFLGNQNRLDEEHEFEVVIQHTTSRGRGRITNRYYHPEKEEGVWLLKLALIDKMRAVVKELEDEVRRDKDALWNELRSDGEYGEAWKVLTTYHADFEDIEASVRSVLSRMAIEVKPLIVDEVPVRTVTKEAPAAPVPLISRIGRRLPVWDEDTDEDIAGKTLSLRFSDRTFSSHSGLLSGRIASKSVREDDEDAEDEVTSTRSSVVE